MKDILLIIDMQNVYKKGQLWGCPNFDMITANIMKLLSFQHFDTVFFTRHLPNPFPKGTWQRYNRYYEQINASSFQNELIPELLPMAVKHHILEKYTYSACSFLPQDLFKPPLPRFVITGVIAHCCVLSTVMDLIDQGTPIIFLKDAVAGQHKNFEKMTAAIVNSFSPIHTKVMNTKEYLSDYLAYNSFP